MVPALTVLGLVIDGAALDLHLADAQVPLEVGGIVDGVPETEFHIGKKGERFVMVRVVAKSQTIDLTGGPEGDKGEQIGTEAVRCSVETAVAEAVAALVLIKRRLGRHGTGVPDVLAVMNVVVFSVGIDRDIIVAVPGDSEQLGILIEAVTAAGIGNQRKKVL